MIGLILTGHGQFACAPGNPFMPTLEETIAFYKELF